MVRRMALQINLSLTANDTPGTANIIPGGTVSASGPTESAAKASILAQLETRKTNYANQAATVQNVQDALNL
jgi:hypothetical protein